jgi:membrane associated rhomboid family serine protease
MNAREPIPLAALHDGRRAGRAPVTWVFLGACVLLTGATLVEPALAGVVGGIGQREHAWQLVTSVFVHGGPGFPAALHLALDAFLIVACGPPCERLLGSGRFLLLSLAAMGANALAQALTGGVNGSSLVIWAWGPPLAGALRASRGARDPADEASAARLRLVLVLMYAVIVLAMGTLPYLQGWRGDPLTALLRANRFHLVATAVGVVAALGWRGAIRRRLSAVAARSA